MMAMLTCATGWAFRPQPPRVHTYFDGRHHVTKTTLRRVELLSFREWGLKSIWEAGSGRNFAGSVKGYKLGFLSIMDEERLKW